MIGLSNVRETLDGLANRVSEDDRNRIEAAVEKRVPLPTKEEYDGIVRDCLAIFGDLQPPSRWAAIAEANITVAPPALLTSACAAISTLIRNS